ncbi:nuclease A inhibitor family protein [Flectobacillus major]|uniref:nuclease A inhibitor family protein n=1 Tax=Flectobacillus major TaxID=103 RepID=UPI00042085F4|nr:nuclease A inhibitor family protein [Flectobacillus major]
MTENPILASLENNNLSLQDEINRLIADLYYPSESDEKIAFVEVDLPTDTPFALSSFKMFLGILPDTVASEISLDEFFAPLLKTEDWFGEEELAWVKSAEALKTLMTSQLTDIVGYKLGSIEIDVYLLGKSQAGNWQGIKTKVVET